MYPFTVSRGFDLYWWFAAERQNIFFKRLAGESYPWTEDPILQKYKFTNVYRVTDRVSQYLIKNVIYNNKYSSSVEEIFFRIILFKLFNKIETWELLCSNFRTVSLSVFNISDFDKILKDAMDKNHKIFSSAYIMPSGIHNPGYLKKHQNCLALLAKMLDDKLPEKIYKSSSMKEAFNELKKYPMMGNFLSYQFIIDINYSDITNFSENEFVEPGPGALRGIRKCIYDMKNLNYIDILEWIVDHQEDEFKKRNLNFKTLYGRKLHKIDCQNIFCEIDKYLREKDPSLNYRTKRIKQLFKQHPTPIEYFFPPKWKILMR